MTLSVPTFVLVRAPKLALLPISLAFLLASLFAQVSCQSQHFVPSQTWRKPAITTSFGELVVRAGGAIDRAVSSLNSTGFFDNNWSNAVDFPVVESVLTTAFLYSQMAEFDRLTNGSKYRDQLTQLFSEANHIKPGLTDSSLDVALSFGYAAVRAWTAYNDPAFLSYAVQSWNFANEYTLSPVEVITGKASSKTFAIHSQCANETLVGGTFEVTDPGNEWLAATSTGNFLILSSLLQEAAPDDRYAFGANASVSFVTSQLYPSAEGNIVKYGISARATDSCLAADLAWPYNTGTMIEGLAILQWSFDAHQSLLYQLVQGAVNTRMWQNSTGIISNRYYWADGRGDLYLVRGLLTAYERNHDPVVRDYLREYLSVQYNAVTDFAAGDDNVYGGPWTGPPSSEFEPLNQTYAISALLAAISIQTDSLASSSHSKKKMDGAIAGGVVGAAVLAAAILAFTLFRRRKVRQARYGRRLGSTVSLPYTGYPLNRVNSVHSVQTTISAIDPVKVHDAL